MTKEKTIYGDNNTRPGNCVAIIECRQTGRVNQGVSLTIDYKFDMGNDDASSWPQSVLPLLHSCGSAMALMMHPRQPIAPRYGGVAYKWQNYAANSKK